MRPTPEPTAEPQTSAHPGHGPGPGSSRFDGEPEPAPVADCVFCRIVAGELPSRQIYADAHCVAFLDLTGWHRGHSLVIPRRHVADVVSGGPSLPQLAPAVDAVARLLVARLDADGVNLLSSAGAAAGQTVFHAHVHVVPRYAAEPGLDRLINPSPVPDAELDAVWRQLREGS